MKRTFLLLCAFFLNSCVFSEFQTNSGCPIRFQGQHFSILFEYGSAELNETAVRQIQEAAVAARENRDFVCLLGRLSYQGPASDQALGALDRAKNTAAIFIQEGIRPEQMYVGMTPQNDNVGFTQPLSAKEETHTLEVLIGK